MFTPKNASHATIKLQSSQALEVHPPLAVIVVLGPQLPHTLLQRPPQLVVTQAPALGPRRRAIILHHAVPYRADLKSAVAPRRMGGVALAVGLVVVGSKVAVGLGAVCLRMRL
ncbi:hypothetical protein G7046_g10116 [Stylonectria norvegica]|nr:hypothetical protein G7046_g10116 [Stylonectria norvegica]